MELNFDLKKFFKNEDGKPNNRNIIIATVIGAILILILKSTLGPSSEPEGEVSPVGVNYNLPQPEQKGSVRIGTNADIHYITRGEMEYVLARQLEEFAKRQSDALSIVLQETQNKLLQIIEDQSQLQQEYLESSFKEKLSKFEKDLYSLKQSQEDLEELIVEVPRQVYSQSSTSPGTSAGTTGGQAGPVLRPDIPVNSYAGTGSYQPSYSGGPSSQTEVRRDSGFIVNSFRTTDAQYIVNVGQIYERGFTHTDGIPSGAMYSGILLTGAVSSPDSRTVIVMLTEDVIVNNKVLVPKETRLIGEAVTDYNTRQIYFNIKRLVLNDREVSVKAALVKKDGTPGFCSKYIDKTNEALWKNIAVNFATTLLQGFKDVTYYVSDQGIPVKTYDDTAMNRIIDASSAGLLSVAEKIVRDAQAMGAIILVDPNIEVKIMIEENISLEKLRG